MIEITGSSFLPSKLSTLALHQSVAWLHTSATFGCPLAVTIAQPNGSSVQAPRLSRRGEQHYGMD